jgi:hypothetical protein
MELDGHLRGHTFMHLELPPQLWEADTEDEPFLRMLGEVIVVGLGRGNELADLVLTASNVTVEADEEPLVSPGDYVAVTVRGAGGRSGRRGGAAP